MSACADQADRDSLSSISAPEPQPSLSESAESSPSPSEDSAESTLAESSLSEPAPWSPSDYPDPTLPENMAAGIYYRWEHLEYQAFGDPAQFQPHAVELLGLNDESVSLNVTIRLPGVYSFGEYNRIMYDGGFQELLPAGDAVYCESYDATKSFVENGMEHCKQRSVDFMLGGADYEMVEQDSIAPGSYLVTDKYVRCIFGESMDNLELVYLVKAGENDHVLLAFSVSPQADSDVLSLYDFIAGSVEGSGS